MGSFFSMILYTTSNILLVRLSVGKSYIFDNDCATQSYKKTYDFLHFCNTNYSDKYYYYFSDALSIFLNNVNRRIIYMSKKSIKFISTLSSNTQRGYRTAITKYEQFHGMSIDELINEALDEQTKGVAPHLLSIIDRIEDFQEHLIEMNHCHGSINSYMGKIKNIYKKNRVVLPYLETPNPKRTRRREYIEYKDVLSKEEIKQAVSYMRPSAKARAYAMFQGGLSNEECEHLKTRSFIDELYKYHQCDNDVDALIWLSNPNNPVIWVTKLIRQKTKKPYYAILGAEAVNHIASAKLYEKGLPHNNGQIPDKLLDITKHSFQVLCQKLNNKLGFGLVAEESKFKAHNLRRFHATYIRGSVLTYEENSLTLSEIDEMQGRGKTATQDTYIKSNPLEQKLLYAKVMNNLSLDHEYEFEIIDGDVIIYLKNQMEENKKLRKINSQLEKELAQRTRASKEMENLNKKYGKDTIQAILQGILNAS